MYTLKPKLLVIDDEAPFAGLVEAVATRCGYDVESYACPNRGLIESVSNFSVVVLDLRMPDFDGIEFLRMSRSASPKPQLVLASGLDTRTLGSAAEYARCAGFPVAALWRKPVSDRQIAALLAERARAAEAAGPVAAKPSAAPISRPTLSELQQALDNDEFVVHFQPQISLAGGKWSGVEALVRWEHPARGLLYPGAFVEYLENSALSLPFTMTVIKTALAGAARLADECGFEGDLAVNVPPTALNDASFPEMVEALLQQSGFPASRLVIEITETSLPPKVSLAKEIEVRLRLRGIRLSIDDFGTGYSSLERLSSVPFSELKIDLIFVGRAARDESARAVIEYAIHLGRRLGMKVVAEGVEDAWTLRWLASVKCDIAQGYAIGRPQSVDRMVHWARERRSSSRGDPLLFGASSSAV